LWSIGVGVICGERGTLLLWHPDGGFPRSGSSLLGRIGELIGQTSLQGALLLIILGASLVLKPWFDKRQFFGKAEESRV
jgi:hypothetical protein